MDTKQIKALMHDFDNSGLAKLKITQKDFTIELEKSVAQNVPLVAPNLVSVPQAQVPQVLETPVKSETLSIVSPMVGTFYSAPSPDSPDFVKIGDVVRKGQGVAIIEAMKIMNEVEAEFECRIVDILVKNGQVVEYEMPLFAIEKL